MGLDFNNSQIKKHIAKAEFGLEKESLRVKPDGSLAHTQHPFLNDVNIDRDFCENQIEIISDVFNSADELLEQMSGIHDRIFSTLAERNEILWPFSNPPVVHGEDDVPVAEFTGELQSKSVYRRYLAEKYGKMKMLFSGIHFNFSFSGDLIAAVCSESGETEQECKNSLYMELAAKLVKYDWLIVYLTSASPVMDSSFIRYSGFGENADKIYSSVRCSKVGYWNDFIPVLDYSSVENYVKSVQKYIDSGNLKSVSELYYPVRIKPRGKNTLEALTEKGINHVELRTLDLNPLTRNGIFKEDIEFIHLFMLYLMSLDEALPDENVQIASVLNIKKAAMYDDINNCIELFRGSPVPLKTAAGEELERIEAFAEKYLPEFLDVVAYQKAKIKDEKNRYSFKVRKLFEENYVEKGIKLATEYEKGVRLNV